MVLKARAQKVSQEEGSGKSRREKEVGGDGCDETTACESIGGVFATVLTSEYLQNILQIVNENRYVN